ncbi:hypothetical protein GN958_ATG01509 [Phytophthora infestans]|uniref:Tc1-like transposase DDE domain-containing protein n=1 Tax=Phytophthora infestans TaxID=4787 RepID=A0A8S9VF06_PHYIN|nr:hypothetical protein GN958_ATG01509 [Phytophthora infestans]
MFWGSIFGNGVGPLHMCAEAMDGEFYRRILRSQISLTRAINDLSTPTQFVHDNAPAHCAKAATKCLKKLKLPASAILRKTRT